MKDPEKILSILIPTYNRADILLYTLSLFEDQIKRNDNEVDLIVCNNASTDNTENALHEFYEAHPFFKIISYTEHVDVGNSIIRSAENAIGLFFMVFADDDIPSPFMTDMLLSSLKKYPNVGKLVFNRLVGRTKENNLDVESLNIVGTSDFSCGEKYYPDLRVFASEHQNEQGFVSVSVVRTEMFKSRYKDVYPNDCLGFEHVVPFMYAAKEFPVLYLQYPLLIQRRPSLSNQCAAHDFNGVVAFLYFTIGRPRAIKRQWELGLLNDFNEVLFRYNYHNNNGSVSKEDKRKYFYQACLSWSKELRPYAKELCEYQSDLELRKMLQRMLSSTGIVYKLWKSYYRSKLYGYKWLIGYPLRKIKRMF